MAAKVNPRSITVEGPFIPSDPVSARRMEKLFQMLENRHSDWRLMAGMKLWLERKAAGIPDRTAPSTRSRYRRAIEEIGKLDPDPVSRRRRSREERAVELALLEQGQPKEKARAIANLAGAALGLKPPIIDLVLIDEAA